MPGITVEGGEGKNIAFLAIAGVVDSCGVVPGKGLLLLLVPVLGVVVVVDEEPFFLDTFGFTFAPSLDAWEFMMALQTRS